MNLTPATKKQGFGGGVGADSQTPRIRHPQHRRAATGGDGVDTSSSKPTENNNWARTLGWIESNRPNFGVARRSEHFSAINESPVPRAGGGAQGFGRGESDDPFALVLGRRKSAGLARVGGELGQDPREAAKLMKTSSFFVEVEPISARGHIPSRSTAAAAGAQSVSARRKSDHASHRHRGSDSNIVSTYKHRGVTPASTGSRPTAQQSPPMSPSACSSGGYAFSCDAQTQQAEIAMILGERPAPMHQTANFCEQRSSLRAQRIERARDNIAGGEEKHGDNEIVGGRDGLGQATAGGARSGLAGLAPLLRRNSFTFGSECSSPSASSVIGHASSGPRERRDGEGVDTSESSGISRVQDEGWTGLGIEEPQLLPKLHLIVEEKVSDDEGEG